MLKKLGKYEIIEELGRGAMGDVFKARDPLIGRLVALKTISGALVGKPDLLARFYQEARSAGTLQHPNIVTVYELGKEGDTPYIAMEYLEGESLEKVIERRRPLLLSQKLGFIVPVCRALEYAHKRGVVHRDIKPGNVMVTTEGSVKVVDFGIARLLDASRTQTGMLIGTLGYMAPQLIQGERADERSDIWAVGVMFYELLCYERPFAGENHAALMMNIMTKEARPIGEASADCPAEVAALVHRMLRKDISERFQSMEEVLLELDSIWRHIQMARVTELISESKEKIAARDFPNARELLRKALQIDTTNLDARTLLERVNAELRRIKVLPQVKERVEKAQSLLQAGHLQEARVEAEAVLQLDSSFEPARDALRQILEAVERNRLLQERLRHSRQHLAEGALTQAQQQLEMALELDPASPQALELKKQILLETERDEKRVRLLEMLHRARDLWRQQNFTECLSLIDVLRSEFSSEAEVAKLREAVEEDQAEQNKQQKLAEGRALLAAKRFEQCLTLLDQLQKDFPGEPEAARLRDALQEEQAEYQKQQKLAEARGLLAEKRFESCLVLLEDLDKQFPGEAEITKLLATVRGTQAEQQKQRKLAEARSLLAEQRCAEALAVLDALIELHPNDPAARKLYKIVQQEQDEQKRLARLQQERAALKSLVNEEKSAEAVTRGEKLLQEFSGDFELLRLVEFARAQQKQQEQAARLRQIRTELQSTLETGRYDAALQTAQKGLESFPGDTELLRLREQALAKQKEKEKRELLERRIREIRAKINRDELTDAITLARQTLMTAGDDTDITQLLQAAEMEHAQRERKKAQDHELDSARTLIEEGELDEAAGVIHRAIETKLFDTYDPRAQRVLEEIEEKKKTPTGPAPAEAASPTAKAAEPATAYVFEAAAPQQGAPVAPADASSAKTLAASAAAAPSARAASPPVAQPVMPPVAQTGPPPPAAQTAPPLVEQSASPSAVPAHDPKAAAPVLPATPTVPSAPRAPVAEPRPRAQRPTHSAEQPAAIPPAVPAPIWKRPAIMAAAALGLVAILWVASHFLPTSGPKEIPPQQKVTQPGPKVDPIEAQQQAAIDDANKRIATNDFDGARDILQKVGGLQGPLAPQIVKLQGVVEAGIRNEKRREQLQREEQLWQKALEQFNNRRLAEAKRSFQQVGTLFPEGRHRDEVRQYVEVKIPPLEKEESLFKQAQQAQQRGDKASLQRASDLLGQVMALNGRRQQDAQQLQITVRSGLDQFAREERFASLLSGARQDVKRSDFREARQKAAQIRQSGGDGTGISAEIDQAEQTRFARLVDQFNQLKQRADDSARQQLVLLSPQFRSIADGGGPRAEEARSFSENRIPAAVKEIEGQMKNAEEAAAFKQAVAHFDRAVSTRDPNALKSDLKEFQAILQHGGAYAAQANEYVTDRIPNAITALTQLSVSPEKGKENPPSTLQADREAILAVLKRYQAAYEHRNVNEFTAVFPDLDKAGLKKIRDFFREAESIRMELTVLGEPTVSGDKATVICQRSLQMIMKGMQGGIQKPEPDRISIRVKKSDIGWVIDSVDLPQSRALQ